MPSPTPDIEQVRAERVAGDRNLLVMSLEHAKRHAVDIVMVSTGPERARALQTVKHVDMLLEVWGER